MTDIISWYALRVAPQSELRVHRILHQRERPAVVPVEMFRRLRERNGKPPLTVKRERPLFPGYVFLGLHHPGEAAIERAWINQAEGRPIVHGLVGIGGKPSVLTARDVGYLMTISDELKAARSPDILSVGDTVKFRDGHIFERQSGPVVKIRGKDRTKVNVMLRVFDGMRVVETDIGSLVAA